MPTPVSGLPVAVSPTGIEAAHLRRQKPTEVAREFEALLLTQLIGAMRRTVPSGGMLEASATRRMLDGAFDHEMARALVAGGGLGIARQIEAQIAGGKPRASSFSAAGAPPIGAASALARVDGGKVQVGAAAAAPVGPDVGGRAAAIATTDAPADDTALQTPLDGHLTSGFGIRRDPITGQRRFHPGVDLAAPRGTAIHAAADGEVVFSGWRGRGGNVVEVRHTNGLVTSYAHAERLFVRPGQKVGVGDVIATVGSSGRSTGPHLHFTARRGGQVIDPTTVFPRLGDGAEAG